MANVQVGNSYYVDSTGVLSSRPTRVVGILITATAANASCMLQDNSDGGAKNKLDVRNATSGTTQHFRLEGTPVFFPGGIKISAISSAVVMIITSQAGDAG